MPFKSKAQQGAAFGGFLGPEMKAKAPEFAKATPDLKGLPQHVGNGAQAPAKKPNPFAKKTPAPASDPLGNVAPAPKKRGFSPLGSGGNPMAGLAAALKTKA